MSAMYLPNRFSKTSSTGYVEVPHAGCVTAFIFGFVEVVKRLLVTGFDFRSMSKKDNLRGHILKLNQDGHHIWLPTRGAL